MDTFGTHTETSELQSEMSLQEFISQPNIVPFQFIYTERIRRFIEERPYIRIGTILSNTYGIAYTEQDRLGNIIRELGENFINVHVTGLTLLNDWVLYDSGISQVQQFPTLDLRGQGVLLGFVDTGIDYTLPAFRYEDGSSKIACIWDQTIPGAPPEQMGFGSVYTRAQLGEALRSPNPFDVVPQRDNVGHGTFLASVAGGRGENMSAAPDAEIISVKLKQLHPYYLGSTSTPPENENVFGSSDIMLGIQFILDKAAELNRPVAICFALGTNFGGHAGFSLLEEYLTLVARTRGVVICTAAGNESNARHHTDGVITGTGDTQTVEVRVGSHVPDVSVYIWTELWDKISVSIQSPGGEVVRNIPFQNNLTYSKTLVLEKSIVSVVYFESVSRLAMIRIYYPTPGIWQINLFGESIIGGEYHAWLPITGMISPNVDFVTPSPNFTIVVPATALGTITCGAYNNGDNSLYISSSWGPTRLPRMSPDLVAPGVNVSGLYPIGPGTMSGTSVAAAITTGASALMLQWGIVQDNDPDMNCGIVRALLIAGCTRDRFRDYPNVSWGYGRLNLLGSFEAMRD